MNFSYLKRLDLRVYLFPQTTKVVFPEYLFSQMANLWKFCGYLFLRIQVFGNLKFINFRKSTESENKTLVNVNKTYLRLESSTELQFYVLQAIKHLRCIIVYIIFVTIVWYVTIQFPFRMILVTIIFTIVSEAVKLTQKKRG